MFVVRYAAQWTFGCLTPLHYRFEADYERVVFPLKVIMPRHCGLWILRPASDKIKKTHRFFALAFAAFRGLRYSGFLVSFQKIGVFNPGLLRRYVF